MNDLRHRIEEYRNLIFQSRRELHRIPETAFTEQKTAAYLEQYLKGIDLELETGIAQNGIVALMKTGNPGPTVLFRANMDALPIAEANDLPFASTHTGVMHACGHDGHMAMVLGAATVLDQFRDNLCGNINPN